MAEFGAHLDTPIAELPSIFEVLAQDNLNSALRPAFGHLLKVVTEVNISALLPLWQWKDEIFTTVELGLQHFCLKYCGASFAESFYGLIRLPVGFGDHATRPGYKLPPKFHRRSLICLVLVPYLKLKADALFEKLRGEQADGASIPQSTTKQQAQNLLLKLYPLFHFLWEILVLYYQVGYALGRKTFPGPLFDLAGTQLTTSTDEESSDGPVVDFWNMLRDTRWHSLPVAFVSYLRNNSRQLLSVVLSLGTFFLQFLDWWYSNDNLTRSSIVSVIPPPKQDRPGDFVKELNVCPICSRTRTNDTVLSSSGYVFCYPCIYKYVNSHSQCPVTRLPTNLECLVRLYSDSSVNS